MQLNKSITKRENTILGADISKISEILESSHMATIRTLALLLLRELELARDSENILNKVIEGEKILLYKELQTIETTLIRSALIRTGGNQLKAANLLGIKHTTMNTKIKRYKISLTKTELEN